MNKYIIPLYILLLFLTSSCSVNQRIDLKGPWKILYNDEKSFKEIDINDSQWETIYLPVQTKKDATVVWIRNTFKIPDSLKNQSLAIFVGKIIDTDIVYINGKEIGRSGKEPPHYIPMWNYNRYYQMPPDYINQKGINTIAIRSYAVYDPKFSDTPFISTIESVHWHCTLQNILTRTLPLSSGIIILTIGLFSIILFLFNRGNKTQLLFGIASILWGILSLHFYIHNYDIYYNLKEKIYFSLMAIEIALIYVLLENILKIRIKVLEVIVFLITVITIAHCFSYNIHDHMMAKGYFYLGIFAITEQLLWGILIGVAIIKKRENILIVSIGYGFFMLGIIHDSLAITGLYIIEVYHVSFSYPALLLSFGIIFIKEFISMEQRLKFMNKIEEKNSIISNQKRELELRNITLENDLTLAKAIQKEFIPKKMPNKKIHAIYKPMEAIGGDFYDFIHFEDEDLLGIIISDVSGHGVPAALITAMFKGYIEEAGDLKLYPSELLIQLNKTLLPLTGMNFITVFYGIFNKKTYSLKYVNAGHTIPFIIRDQKISSLLGKRSVPIAIFNNEQLIEHKKTFFENEITLEKGSRMVLYTDGLTEARNLSTPMEDFERTTLFSVLTDKADDTPKAFIKRIYSELIKYKGDENLEDDVCIICLDV